MLLIELGVGSVGVNLSCGGRGEVSARQGRFTDQIRVRGLIEKLIKTIEPSARLLSFGSSCNSFGLRNSGMPSRSCNAQHVVG
jgi:hypothetical protein